MRDETGIQEALVEAFGEPSNPEKIKKPALKMTKIDFDLDACFEDFDGGEQRHLRMQ